jgi:hypothetical protein
MFRFLLACIPLLLLSAQPQAFAKSRSASGPSGQRCEPKKKHGFLKSVVGQVANSALGAAGVPSGVAGVYVPVGSLLSSAIIDRLDCREQVQAATATTTAVRGGVGTTSSWQSESRDGVSGSSTVLAQNNRSDGTSCMTVNDVIIVNGEEVTAAKTMCRAPGANGYTLQT